MLQLPVLRVATVATCALAMLATPVATQADHEDSSTVTGPWLTAGLPRVVRGQFRVPSDPDIRFIVNDGSAGPEFAQCTSVAPGQPTISDQTRLPVGNGRELACTIEPSFVVREQMLMGQDGRFYCWKGAAVKYRSVSDERLQVRVVPGTSGQPWTLRASSEEAFDVVPAGFFAGSVWPVWLDVSYQTTNIALARNNRCEGVF